MNPLLFLLVRILRGEPLRKPTPEENREWAVLFVMMAILFGLMALTARYARHFLDTVNALTLTVIAAVVVCAFFFVPRTVGRYVPAKLSYLLGAIAWVLLFSLAVTGHLV